MSEIEIPIAYMSNCEKPLQALRLDATLGVLALGIGGIPGLLGGRGIDGLLYFAFSPMVLVIAGEAFLAIYRLARRPYSPCEGQSLVQIGSNTDDF